MAESSPDARRVPPTLSDEPVQSRQELTPVGLARREEILRTATRLFATRGFHATRMNDIADAVHINKASLYYYFSSKSVLLYNIFWRSGRILESATRTDRDWSPSYGLSQCTNRIAQAVIADPHGAAVYFRESLYIGEYFTDEQLARVRRSESAVLQNICDQIGRGIESGEFRECDRHTVATAYLSTLLAAHRWLPVDRVEGAEASAVQLADLIVRGLSLGKRSGRAA
ncbi:TetR/AcrR family transcriptional regulator [Mycobacterium sp. C31M]